MEDGSDEQVTADDDENIPICRVTHDKIDCNGNRDTEQISDNRNRKQRHGTYKKIVLCCS